ncbi:MAG: hypothetical protein IJN72_01455 [Firmicutes bacterium]|nr:hypothetical protein [Bacillota bacterium]
MKRFTILLLITVIVLGCFGCSNEMPGDKLVDADFITALTDKGIPEKFLENLETADLMVMHDELLDVELGEIKFTETITDEAKINMLIVPVKDGCTISRTTCDCIRVYGTYIWNNRGITFSREDEIELTYDGKYLSNGSDLKLTRSYKGKPDGSKMKCIYDESGFATLGQGYSRWYHPVKLGFGKHVQKGVFGLVLAPTYMYAKVHPLESAEKIEIDVSLEYKVHKRVKKANATQEDEPHKLILKTELYIPE